MRNPRLRRIIRRLQLRNIHNPPTHTRRRNKTAIREPLQSIPKRICALLFLPPPDLPRRLRTVVRAVEISRNNLVEVRQLAADHGSLRPGNTRVGDEDVEPAVEFLDLLFDGFVHVRGVEDVDLVCFA